MDDQLRTKIELEDKFENMGAQMVREVASKTSDQAGDGTTTATVLAHAIVREGSKGVAAGMNPMDLKRGIDLAVGAVVADLVKNSKKVTSNEEIARSAMPRSAAFLPTCSASTSIVIQPKRPAESLNRLMFARVGLSSCCARERGIHVFSPAARPRQRQPRRPLPRQ